MFMKVVMVSCFWIVCSECYNVYVIITDTHWHTHAYTHVLLRFAISLLAGQFRDICLPITLHKQLQFHAMQTHRHTQVVIRWSCEKMNDRICETSALNKRGDKTNEDI